MTPFSRLFCLTGSFCSFIASVYRMDGGGFLSFSPRDQIYHIHSKIHQCQAPFPSKILVLYSPALRQACGSGTSQSLAPSPSTPFWGASDLGCMSLFPSSPFLWWIHPNPTLEPVLAEGGWAHASMARWAQTAMDQIWLSGKSKVSPECPTLLACRAEGRERW